MDDKKVAEYAHIDQLVFEYQAGSEAAGEELIRHFGYDAERNSLSRYLGKYYKLLRSGVINFHDKDTRQFLRCFTKDKNLKDGLVPFYQYAATKKATRKLVEMINFRMRHIKNREMVHDLSMLLLVQAKKYRKQGTKTNFCGYLYNSYRYKVYEHYKHLFTDALYTTDIEMMEDHRDANSEIIIKETLKDDLYFRNEKDELGFNWILGKSATYPFTELTVFERTLLHLHEHKRMTYEQVGAQMGYHRDTVWNKRRLIKEKLAALIEKTPCD